MPKLTKRAIRYVQTYVRTDPNYRKASLSKTVSIIDRRSTDKITSKSYMKTYSLEI